MRRFPPPLRIAAVLAVLSPVAQDLSARQLGITTYFVAEIPPRHSLRQGRLKIKD